jgi:hypothetical protein
LGVGGVRTCDLVETALAVWSVAWVTILRTNRFAARTVDNALPARGDTRVRSRGLERRIDVCRPVRCVCDRASCRGRARECRAQGENERVDACHGHPPSRLHAPRTHRFARSVGAPLADQNPVAPLSHEKASIDARHEYKHPENDPPRTSLSTPMSLAGARAQTPSTRPLRLPTCTPWELADRMPCRKG